MDSVEEVSVSEIQEVSPKGEEDASIPDWLKGSFSEETSVSLEKKEEDTSKEKGQGKVSEEK